MAILKFGSFVTEGSGSLAGHTIQNSKGGSQLRTKPVPKNYPSPDQLAIRSYNKIMQQGWRDLYQAQRDTWRNYAASYTIHNKYGDRHILSGHSLWMKYNFAWIAAGGSFLPDPSFYGGPILGPELVKNGSFAGPDSWVPGAHWNIAGGYAHYLNTGTGRIYQFLNMTIGLTYLVRFNFSGKVGVTTFALLSTAALPVFPAPYNTWFNPANGQFSQYLLCTRSVVSLALYGTISVSAYSLTNLSLRTVIS